jgi:hypothetical protein
VDRTGPTAPVESALAGAGGAAVVVGAFLAWVSLEVGGGQVFFGTPGETINTSGLGHWTGIVALMAGAAAVLGALGAALFADARSRRRAATVAAVGGVVALAAAGMGWWQREAIAVGRIPGGHEALDYAREFVREFRREGIDVAAEVPKVSAGVGLWIAMGGGAVAAVAGFVSARAQRRPA